MTSEEQSELHAPQVNPSRPPTADDRLTEARYRRTRRAVYLSVFMLVCSGLVYEYESLAFTYQLGAIGRLTRALIGASLVLGSVGLGYAIVATLRMAVRSIRQSGDVVVLQRRLDALETAIEEGAVTVDLTAVGRGQPQDLVGASVKESAYPRIVAATVPDDDDSEPGTSAWPAEDDAIPASPDRGARERWNEALREENPAAAAQALARLEEYLSDEQRAARRAQLHELEVRVTACLRGEFAARVRAGRYESALRIGEEILRKVPEGTIARDFRSLRPLLTARIQPTPTPNDAPAI